jgi:lipoprotein-anchoring transpeptidase ErfK/SrfK
MAALAVALAPVATASADDPMLPAATTGATDAIPPPAPVLSPQTSVPPMTPPLPPLTRLVAPPKLPKPPKLSKPPKPAERAPSRPRAVIAHGVTIEGVAVGGLTRSEATVTVETAFEEPLSFTFGKRRWQATPEGLGARAYIEGAVRRALVARPGSALRLVVKVSGAQVRRYVGKLGSLFARPPENSTLRLKNFQPFLTPSRKGLAVKRLAMTKQIVRALARGQRDPLSLAARVLPPRVTQQTFGPVIVIRRASNQLFLYQGARPWRQFGVATGQSSYPSPLGRWQIVVMQRDPWWYPPDSAWAEGEEPVPPGPGNPLGTRWMGLSAPLVGIHGTPDAASIGYSASHGCIRMRIPDAEWLFDHVTVGTPVFIVNA